MICEEYLYGAVFRISEQIILPLYLFLAFICKKSIEIGKFLFRLTMELRYFT
ncbi:hypothetical protein RhiirA5_357578 [Rhizophagus irregularis]|uniref:Uncharacterized protein n=1 Tax=Rhizophagus irregularis TaxID=588596 RepID=A0A2N0RXV5_9GLOM|nr:hypothetical protein RhiirA5_357578 [Rhizophagus irregularis]PKC68145.1 hypothetical protein RhiirA1_417203 [Rhizophagus irregularis]GET56755.1 hypothetical protein RIR_e64357_A0A2N0RXV5_9GLOM [Rhizophagus irregularis DAOM 181602=DAOM 197198]